MGGRANGFGGSYVYRRNNRKAAIKTKLGHYRTSSPLDLSDKSGDDNGVSLWGRTGFDHVNTPEAACRGRCVGLVNHSHQNKTANQELALAA